MNSALLYTIIAAVIIGMVPRAMPIFTSALGETVDQASGVLNLGVEGIMLMGAIIALEVDFFTHDIVLAFIVAGVVGMMFAAVHGIVSILLHGDQVISGTAIWFIGWGISGVMYASTFGLYSVPPSVAVLPTLYIPYLTSIPIIGKLFFGEDPVVYIMVVILVVVQYVMFHTKFGLNLRTAGEDPRVAEIMGVNPVLYRFIAVLFGGFMAGIGGAYLIIGIVGSFYFDMTAGMGFIAVALVYFGKWTPWRVLVGSLIFGAVYILYLALESVFPSVSSNFFAMWPYLATLVLIFAVGAKSHAPSSLALPYLRE
ncbi:MAG: ABC transporter permease [Nitrososphaerota archaeon]|jgi:simple sugar transport system permease protein|nr:ABC transporter permease [Nitrososphaerota archaeon]MDG6930231.1 ABC transporter permease [Nitrososphaerota archaeon]MDG6932645.1 ABC transporter permease [Nitrososphaerota archaeon]MDG6935563.1 ABC transporter permease [Nitrososphaerota archaeon]MDG6944007.1 ABC transporter permease [Nitrososphaerota archaeon]